MKLKEFMELYKDREISILLYNTNDITNDKSWEVFYNNLMVIGAEHTPSGSILVDVVPFVDNDGFDDDFEYSDGYLHRVKEPNTSRGILYNIKLFYQKVFDKVKCFFVKMYLYGRKHPIMYLIGCFCFGIMARLFVCKMFGFDFWRNGYKKKK